MCLHAAFPAFSIFPCLQPLVMASVGSENSSEDQPIFNGKKLIDFRKENCIGQFEKGTKVLKCLSLETTIISCLVFLPIQTVLLDMF